MRHVTRIRTKRRVISTGGIAAFGATQETVGLADGLGIASAVAVGFFGGDGEASAIGSAAAASLALHGAAGLTEGSGVAIGVGESLAEALGEAPAIGVAAQ